MSEYVFNRFSSGRFLLTMAAAVVFVWMAITGMMPAEDVQSLVLMVFAMYFTMPRNGNGSTTGGDGK